MNSTPRNRQRASRGNSGRTGRIDHYGQKIDESDNIALVGTIPIRYNSQNPPKFRLVEPGSLTIAPKVRRQPIPPEFYSLEAATC